MKRTHKYYVIAGYKGTEWTTGNKFFYCLNRATKAAKKLRDFFGKSILLVYERQGDKWSWEDTQEF